MKGSCSDRSDLIGGVIGVPNIDGGEVDEGSPHHVGDDFTCISALSWGGRSQETIDQRQPHKRTSQGATKRRLHPFPWSTSNDDSGALPDNSLTVKQMSLSFASTDAAATINDGDRPLRRSTLVANESSLDGKFST